MAEARAVVRYVRMAPRKVRLIIDMVRGRNAAEAQAILKYMPQAAARVVEQLLHSALANAGQKEMGEPEDLKVLRAFVDGGPIYKRFRPRSMGRANPIQKRTSHITIVVGQTG